MGADAEGPLAREAGRAVALPGGPRQDHGAERLAQEVIKLPIEQQRKIVERWFPAHLELSDV